jgi:hypothetical protein
MQDIANQIQSVLWICFALSVAFGARIGRKVSFETHEDPSLLAGVKVTVGGVTYDGTMRSQLSRLRETLSRAPVAQVSTQH